MYFSIILLYSLQKQHASASGLRSQAVQALCIFSRQEPVGNSYQAGTSDSNDHTVRTSFAAGGNHRPASITEYQAHHKTIPFSLSFLVLDLHHPNPHLSIFNATAMTVSIRVFTAAYSGAGHQLSFWDTSISITFIRNLHFWSWTVSISIFTAPYSGVRASAVLLGRNIRSTEQGAGAGPKQYK